MIRVILTWNISFDLVKTQYEILIWIYIAVEINKSMEAYSYTVDISIKFKRLINLHAFAINHRLKFEFTDNSQPFDDLLIFRIKNRRIS